jgi:AAA+ superfamily predicted ATPase
MRRRNHTNQLDMLPRAFRPLALLWLARLLVNLPKGSRFLHSEQVSPEELLKPLQVKGLTEADYKDVPLLRRALRARHQELETLAPALPASSVLTRNLLNLGALVGLKPAELEVLTFLLLGRQLVALERLLDLNGGLSSAGFHHILAAALKLPISRVQRALEPAGRLARSGLVQWDLHNKWDFSNKVELMPGLYERLCLNQKETFGLFASCFVPAPRPRLGTEAYPHLGEDLAILKPFLQRAIAQRRKGVNILLHGRPGGGKTQFVRMLATALGCDLFEVATETAEREPIPGDHRFRSYHLSQTILRAAPNTLVLFDEVEDVFRQMGESDHPGRNNRSGIKAWVNRTLEENPVPAFWITNQLWVVDPAFTRRFDYVLELDVPPRSVRQQVLNSYLGDLAVDPRWSAAMAEHQGLMPAVVERSTSVVRMALEGNPALDVARALPRALGNTLEALGTTREPRIQPSFSTRYRPEILNTDCDLAAMIPGLRRQGSGRLCFYGPPGTGKTAFGHHLAQELDLPLLVRRASDLLGMYVGENEKNIARMFAEARQENAVLLLDEADSFLQDRKGAQRSWELTLVNEMLTQMEAFPGIFIASTNLMDTLEPAALRRFDLKVRFSFLQPAQALLMFEDLAQGLGLPVDAPARTALGGVGHLTPGDFAAVAQQVRFRPAATALDLAERLAGESSVKPESRRRAIGFPAPLQDKSPKGEVHGRT